MIAACNVDGKEQAFTEMSEAWINVKERSTSTWREEGYLPALLLRFGCGLVDMLANGTNPEDCRRIDA